MNGVADSNESKARLFLNRYFDVTDSPPADPLPPRRVRDLAFEHVPFTLDELTRALAGTSNTSADCEFYALAALLDDLPSLLPLHLFSGPVFVFTDCDVVL